MIRILERPHEEAKDLLATGAPVFIEVNPVEYHGPHLSLRNDALVSHGLVKDLHAKLAQAHPDWPLLLATGIDAGVDVVPGPGAREASYATLRELVLDAARSLVELGAKRVVFMTFHGGPLHNVAIHEGVRALEERGVQAFAPLNMVLEELLTLDPRTFAEAFAAVPDLTLRAIVERELPLDFHAGFFETSMTLHYAPETVARSYRSLEPCPSGDPDRALVAASRFAEKLGRKRLAAELKFAAAGRGWYELDPFPGYTGRPSLAEAGSGAVFAREIINRYAARAESIFSGQSRSPEPILRWAETLTLGGRIGRNHLPEPRPIPKVPAAVRPVSLPLSPLT